MQRVWANVMPMTKTMKNTIEDTTSSSSVIPPYSSSSNAMPSPTIAASSNAEDWKLWPPPVEKHFSDVLVKEEAKGNMPGGQFKKGLWTIVQNEFNQQAEKAYCKDQLR
ncbi:hypothetical protein SO802_022811 [Lithocarpus litseifolius]|uniref:Myb/SANT-like domain-containing protein n=1 Tax=Lithocarpus litseifolius TaxID=425828 RepID=A0AAW2C6D5_9ROSI